MTRLNKIKTFLAIVVFVKYISLSAWSQSVTPELISAAGFDGSMQGTYLSSAIGEPLISTLEGSFSTISQGFLQSAAKEPCPGFEINIFPNPIVDFATISVTGCDIKPHRVMVFDLFGKVVIDHVMLDNKIYMKSLSPALYVVNILDIKDELLSSFRIVKRLER